MQNVRFLAPIMYSCRSKAKHHSSRAGQLSLLRHGLSTRIRGSAGYSPKPKMLWVDKISRAQIVSLVVERLLESVARSLGFLARFGAPIGHAEGDKRLERATVRVQYYSSEHP